METIKIGGTFRHPHLGFVEYIGPDRKYGQLTCELKLVDRRDYISRWPLWQELYDMGFNLELNKGSSC